MYPLDFPLRVLRRRAKAGEWVLDPFCGRGTTNFAARILGLSTVGIDCSPIAVAISAAKLASVTSAELVAAAQAVLWAGGDNRTEIPEGEFWRWAFHERTLQNICRLRSVIGREPKDIVQVVLRAIILGSLHGPKRKGPPAYLSNQAPRTFAPKPDYAVRFWRSRNLQPEEVDVLSVIRRRAEYYLSFLPGSVDGQIRQGDSRDPGVFGEGARFSWVITSPPYLGMRTYIPDQWLRNWFVGGPPHVPYRHPAAEVSHHTREAFVEQLRAVWGHVAQRCLPPARLVCRFGGINDRKADPLIIIRESLAGSHWRLSAVRPAGTAFDGRRQAAQFGERGRSQPRREYDVYAVLY
jgi:DNA methylase